MPGHCGRRVVDGDSRSEPLTEPRAPQSRLSTNGTRRVRGSSATAAGWQGRAGDCGGAGGGRRVSHMWRGGAVAAVVAAHDAPQHARRDERTVRRAVGGTQRRSTDSSGRCQGPGEGRVTEAHGGTRPGSARAGCRPQSGGVRWEAAAPRLAGSWPGGAVGWRVADMRRRRTHGQWEAAQGRVRGRLKVCAARWLMDEAEGGCTRRLQPPTSPD